jgi:hypothetical protein
LNEFKWLLPTRLPRERGFSYILIYTGVCVSRVLNVNKEQYFVSVLLSGFPYIYLELNVRTEDGKLAQNVMS